jgi:menaquinone-dependent protoporphyrinogen oxidase
LVAHALVKNSFGGQFLFSRMGWFTKKMIKMMSKSDEDVKRIQYDAIKEFADVLNS